MLVIVLALATCSMACVFEFQVLSFPVVFVLVLLTELQAKGAVLVGPRADVMIKCISGNSPILWYKNDKRIATGRDYYVDEQNGTLTILRAGI